MRVDWGWIDFDEMPSQGSFQLEATGYARSLAGSHGRPWPHALLARMGNGLRGWSNRFANWMQSAALARPQLASTGPWAFAMPHFRHATVCGATEKHKVFAAQTFSRAATQVMPGPAPARCTRRVMIVSRNEVERRRVQQLLADFDYEVVEARDGREAVRRGNCQRIDLMIVDVMVARVAGEQMLRLLGLPPHMKVLLMADQDAEIADVRDRRTAVLSKQAGPEELRFTLSRLLGKHENLPTQL